MTQLVRETTREDTLLDLSTEDWWVTWCLEAVLGVLVMKHSEFLVLRDLKEVSTTATLDSHGADFGLLRGLGERVP